MGCGAKNKRETFPVGLDPRLQAPPPSQAFKAQAPAGAVVSSLLFLAPQPEPRKPELIGLSSETWHLVV